MPYNVKEVIANKPEDLLQVIECVLVVVLLHWLEWYLEP